MKREYTVEGIMCNKCVNHITEVVSSIDGVENVTVTRSKPEMVVFYQDDDVDGVEAEVIDAVKGIGYPVERL